jgi:hypothetical protein
LINSSTDRAKKQKKLLAQNKLPRKFIQLAIVVFLIKVIIVLNITGKEVGSEQSIHFVKGIWLGADGENYLTGFKALQADGIFSKAYILHYWPAGYPLLIYFLSLLGKDLVLILLAIIQSLIFCTATYMFAKMLFKTKLSNYTFLIYLFILLNPTLSLSSLSIGYESLIASAIMLSATLIIKDYFDNNQSSFRRLFMYSTLLYGFIVFMQPRFLLTGVLVHGLWFISRYKVRFSVFTLVIGILFSLFLPSTLIARNYIATGALSISTNLGETMAVGAGPGATGAYKKRVLDIPCQLSGAPSQRDQQLQKCVVNWYLENPKATIVLAIKKAIYFWSPWTGSLAFGTMARNPWVGLSPAIKIAAASGEGFKLVTGTIGKVISWIWLSLGLILTIYGAIKLYRVMSFERNLAIFGILVVISQLLITMVTIGDHRFRVPIMPISLMFQAIALKSIFRINKQQI